MDSWKMDPINRKEFFQKPVRHSRGDSISHEDDIYQDMVSKLSHLSLLYDVPFSYLVPSERELEDNRIQFFYLDDRYVRILLDGAFSIGRNASIDYSSDIVFLEQVFEDAMKEQINVRRNLQGKNPLNIEQKDTICTGFVLHSNLVCDYRGLEFFAYDSPIIDNEQANVLQALRLEVLSDTILLGLYQGVIQRLVIKEPPEAFHYGFYKENSNNRVVLKKSVRSLDSGKIIYQGNEPVQIEVVQRKNRVVDFRQTAKNLGECKALFPNGKEEINSAHIALEMIQNPYEIQIIQSHVKEKKI